LSFGARVGRFAGNGGGRLGGGARRVLREAVGMGLKQRAPQSRERDAGDETPSRHDGA